MQKNLTILFAFTIFMLLGFALNPTPAFAKPMCKGQDKNTVECGGGGTGGGAPRDIPLCVTLEAVDSIGGIGGIKINPATGLPILDAAGLPTPSTETFCDGDGAGGIHAGLSESGLLDIVLWASPFPRVELDFGGCVGNENDMEGNPILDSGPNCPNRDFAEDPELSFIVSGGKFVGDTSGLAGVTFSAGEDLDFITDLSIGDTKSVKLVVPFTFFSGQIPSPKQSSRTINYGTRLASVKDGGCGLDSSDEVTVTRVTDGCWVVESLNTEACLLLDTGHGSKVKTLLQGRYHMPFKMTLQAFSGNFDVDGVPLDDEDNKLNIAKLENGMCQ